MSATRNPKKTAVWEKTIVWIELDDGSVKFHLVPTRVSLEIDRLRSRVRMLENTVATLKGFKMQKMLERMMP